MQAGSTWGQGGLAHSRDWRYLGGVYGSLGGFWGVHRGFRGDWGELRGMWVVLSESVGFSRSVGGELGAVKRAWEVSRSCGDPKGFWGGVMAVVIP